MKICSKNIRKFPKTFWFKSIGFRWMKTANSFFVRLYSRLRRLLLLLGSGALYKIEIFRHAWTFFSFYFEWSLNNKPYNLLFFVWISNKCRADEKCVTRYFVLYRYSFKPKKDKYKQISKTLLISSSSSPWSLFA